MDKKKKILNLVCIFLTASIVCGGLYLAGREKVEANSGIIYYISSSRGNDANDGTDISSPWKTFANLRNMALGPGDKVLLRRGDTWNSRLTILGKGSSNNYIYIGPYGDINASAPVISLTNHRDDIAIVVQDFLPNGNSTGMGYIHIDNLQIQNTRMGIYFRNITNSGPEGFKVTNMNFKNIDQPDVVFNLSRRFTDQKLNSDGDHIRVGVSIEDNVSIWRPMGGGSEDDFQYKPDPSTGRFSTSIPFNGLAFFDGQADYEVMVRKGNLDIPNSSAMGGDTEYVFPTAIFFGGKRSGVNVSSSPVGFKNIDISNIILDNVFFGIGGDFIYNPSSDRRFFQNIRVTDVTMYQGQTIFGFTNADYGNPGLDPNNYWGVFRNLNIMSGNPDFLFAGGTTGGFAERASNGYFVDCNFSNIQNGGINPPAGYQITADGCGFDFEGDTSNITITNSIFANNTGQGVLMMQGPRAANSKITLSNNLFYNNLLSAMEHGNNYRWDITVWNNGNTNINFTNNRHVHRNMTDGGVRPDNFINRHPDQNRQSGSSRGYGDRNYTGLSETGASFRNDNNLGTFGSADFNTEVISKGLSNALKVATVTQTTNNPTLTPTPDMKPSDEDPKEEPKEEPKEDSKEDSKKDPDDVSESVGQETSPDKEVSSFEEVSGETSEPSQTEHTSYKEKETSNGKTKTGFPVVLAVGISIGVIVTIGVIVYTKKKKSGI